MGSAVPPSAGDLVEQALSATTPVQVDALSSSLCAYGAMHERPVGDRWGNRGLFTAAGGTFDHKLVELVTNMHDAVVHHEVARKVHGQALTPFDFANLFDSPESAVQSLLGGHSRPELAALARVELHSAGDAIEARRQRTVVFRDNGIGMSPGDLPDALFRVGSSRKDGLLWQMGAFGRGGLTVLPNCNAWIVVTRKQPDLLASGEADIVSIATVRWVKVGNRQTSTAVYEVTSPWESDGDIGLPLAVPANTCDFPPGTYLAVVGFEAEGIWVSRLGDERSLDTLLDTRLFEPALPLTLRTPVFGERGDRQTLLRGLGRRLVDNPRADRLEGREELPFNHDRRTYRLPIRYFLFSSGDTGARRRFVARDHALMMNSNGQVHAHWSPAEFRQKTRLPKLADRILVVVDTDALPLSLRTGLFTADRTELLRNADAVRLEAELISFLDDWEELWRVNNDLIRDAIRRSNVDRSTAAVGKRIARALRVRGFGGRVTPPDQTGVRSGRRLPPPAELLDDPTSLTGPAEVVAIRGRTRGVYFDLNARDGFIPRRANLHVRCTHPDVDSEADVTLGELRNGRIRVAIAVPPDAAIGDSELDVEVPSWGGHAGGMRPSLQAATVFKVVDPPAPGLPPTREPATRARSDSEAELRSRVALLWTSHEAEPEWDSQTVGDVEIIEADSLAQADGEYAELSGHHFDVPVVKLNEEFTPLKMYSALRAREVGDEGVARAKDRYAVGVGVEMLLLDQFARSRAHHERPVESDWLEAARVAAARGVLAVLPDYDQLVAEAGLEGM